VLPSHETPRCLLRVSDRVRIDTPLTWAELNNGLYTAFSHESRSPYWGVSAESSPYRDAAQLRTLLEGVFSAPYPGAEARQLTRLGLSVAFSFHSPALEVLLDGRPAASRTGRVDDVTVLFGEAANAAPAPDLHFSMSGKVAHPFWTGALNIPAAMALGQVRLEGSLIRALSIAPMMPAMQRVYRELWQAQSETA
jgi:hypothetical protein